MGEHAAITANNGPQPISRTKRWIFRAAALLFAPALLLVLEIGLRLGDVGTPPGLVVETDQSVHVGRHALNPAFEFPYYPATDLSGPEPRPFELPKATDTYRIVFLGGSTVIGFPYMPEVAFPRQVEFLLERQTPGRNVESLNAGITTMNSFAVADLAVRCRACEPDLVVIHTGHNEFYGPGGPASAALPYSRGWFETVVTLRRTRLGQAITRFTLPDAQDLDPFESLPRVTEIPLAGEIMEQAGANFRANLAQAIASAQWQGIPVLVTTVGCNLRDQGPLRSLWPEDINAEDRETVQRLLEEAESALSDSDPEAALERLLQAERLCPDFARLQYRKGQALEVIDRHDEAVTAFRLARDLDGCRFRAPESFRSICREVAAESGDGVYLLDLAAELEADSVPHAPGHDLFLEHVHYNLTGHRLLAERIAEFVQSEILGGAWDAARLPNDDEWAAALGVMPEDDIAACSLALEVCQKSPMQESVGIDEQFEFLIGRIQSKFLQLSPARRESFADLAISSMGVDLCENLIRASAARDQIESSLELAELGVIRRPWSAEMWQLLCQAQARAGQTREAIESIDRALELRPNWSEAIELKRLIAAE